MHNRGRFKFGWDAEKRRGIMTSRYLHITRPGKEKEALERAARAIELQFDYYGPFGFGAVVAHRLHVVVDQCEPGPARREGDVVGGPHALGGFQAALTGA